MKPQGTLPELIRKIKPLYIFILLLAAFIIAKIPYLDLPFYWDEAWVYGRAVRTMADEGLGLDPKALPPELGRGHPLLFHNLSALFLKITDNTIFFSHLFSLLVSCTLLICIYSMTEEIAGKFAGVFAAALLMVQPVFLAQSVLVLPEMMLSLFILLSLWTYHRKAMIPLIFCSAAALMVKESAIALFLCLNLIEIFRFIRQRNIKNTATNLFYVNAGLIPWFIFLLIQKKQLGYYFFPEHTGYMSFKVVDILEKINRGFSFTFLFQGRNIVFALMILCFGIAAYFSIIKRKKETYALSSFIPLSASFIFCFLIFSSVNFFSDRYFLCCIIVFISFFSVLIFNSIRNHLLKLMLFSGAVTAGITSNFMYVTNADHNSGYANSVKLYQQTINYLKENMQSTDTIHAFFNLYDDMTSHYPGYLKKEELKFKNLRKLADDDCRYFIISNVENENEKEQILRKHQPVLVKRIEVEQAWAEVWKRENK